MQINVEQLALSPLFSGLDARALKGLAGLVRPREVAKSHSLFSQGDEPDGCYAVVEGLLKITFVASGGEEMLVTILGAGDVVGELALLDGQPRSAAATALRDTTLAFLPTSDFHNFADQHPMIYRYMLSILSGRLRDNNEALAAHQWMPLNGRLARLLLRLAEAFGQELDDGRHLIRQKFTHEELARMTGSARENVSRQMSTWGKKKVVTRISNYYCIDNADELRSLIQL